MARTEEQKQAAVEATRRWREKNPTAGRDAYARDKILQPETLVAKNRRATAALLADPARREKKRAYARKRSKEWRTANPEKHLDITLRSKYGISLETYERLEVEQEGVCRICSKPETELTAGKRKRLAVDHCHVTGKVRGLLCSKCNRGLGYFLEDEVLLLKAIAYLRGNL